MITSNDFKEVLIKYLNLEDISADEIDDNDALFGDEGLGLDSVDSIELVLAIEKEYGVKITDTTQYDTIFATVQSLLTYINANKQ
ncbi:MAG: phosphopantetheine-binding protein [Campylobacterota bacterium]|nr:phosphopantetheine-binding protein [Campylobacterota bacterium]